MPNIIYVLTNPAMPGLVKIGMTDKDNVQHRMSELYTTGVPFPFECVAARQINDADALEIEKALHTAFSPNRVNPSREFFEIDSEQVQVILRILPGQDVTPGASTQEQDEDQRVATEYRRRREQTSELEFLASLNESGVTIYQRVLALGKQPGMQIKWGSTAFSLNTLSNGATVPLCFGYPPTFNNQQLYTDFNSITRKTNAPQEAVDALRQQALDTGLFSPTGKGTNLSCRTDQHLTEPQLEQLIKWLHGVAAKIREYETPAPNQR